VELQLCGSRVCNPRLKPNWRLPANTCF